MNKNDTKLKKLKLSIVEGIKSLRLGDGVPFDIEKIKAEGRGCLKNQK